MHADISFRRAAKADIARIKEILFNARHQYQIVLPKDYPVGDIDAIGTDHDRGASFVLLRGGRIIGFVVLRPVSNETMALKRLYLDAAFFERSTAAWATVQNKARDHIRQPIGQALLVDRRPHELGGVGHVLDAVVNQ